MPRDGYPMKTAYLFHSDRCCLTDCLVRACTCKAAPEPGPDAPSEEAALDEGAKLVGTVRRGVEVRALSGKVDEMNGALHLHFLTRRTAEDDEDEDE
jgi:hypothetical protein